MILLFSWSSLLRSASEVVLCLSPQRCGHVKCWMCWDLFSVSFSWISVGALYQPVVMTWKLSQMMRTHLSEIFTTIWQREATSHRRFSPIPLHTRLSPLYPRICAVDQFLITTPAPLRNRNTNESSFQRIRALGLVLQNKSQGQISRLNRSNTLLNFERVKARWVINRRMLVMMVPRGNVRWC